MCAMHCIASALHEYACIRLLVLWSIYLLNITRMHPGSANMAYGQWTMDEKPKARSKIHSMSRYRKEQIAGERRHLHSKFHLKTPMQAEPVCDPLINVEKCHTAGSST